MVAVFYAVQAASAVAYVHDPWFQFSLVPALDLNHRCNQTGQPRNTTAPIKKEKVMKNDETITLSLIA